MWSLVSEAEHVVVDAGNGQQMTHRTLSRKIKEFRFYFKHREKIAMSLKQREWDRLSVVVLMNQLWHIQRWISKAISLPMWSVQ